MKHSLSRRGYASIVISYKYGPDVSSNKFGPVTGLYKYDIIHSVYYSENQIHSLTNAHNKIQITPLTNIFLLKAPTYMVL
jgi:hypothetical protein